MKKAYVYLREDTIYAVAVATTAAGVTINTDRVIELGRKISPQKLGRAVMDSLAAFTEGVPELPDWRDHAAPMLRALDVLNRDISCDCVKFRRQVWPGRSSGQGLPPIC